MKTIAEVQNLKAQWVNNPCWDLEETEGFEAYRRELLAFSEHMKQTWECEVRGRIARKAAEWGVTFEQAQTIENLNSKASRTKAAAVVRVEEFYRRLGLDFDDATVFVDLLMEAISLETESRILLKIFETNDED